MLSMGLVTWGGSWGWGSWSWGRFGGQKYLRCLQMHTSSGRCASKDFTVQNKAILSRIFGVGEEELRKVPKKSINEPHATLSYKILQDAGFKWGEMLGHSGVFMMTSGGVENYVGIMQESNFKEIKLPWIINFRLVYKQSLDYLEEKGIAPPAPEILRNYFDILELSKSAEDTVWDALPQEISRVTLFELRMLVMHRYLAWKFEMDVEKVSETFGKYPRLGYRCFRWTMDNIHTLMTNYGFTGDKIAKHMYLIHGNPRNLTSILEIPSLSGIPLLSLAQSRPKILMSPASTLLQIQTLYDTHGISRESILKFPEIYTLAPETVEQRLQEFDTIPEFQPLKNHPRVARLIYYQNKARTRLEFLKELNLTGASLHFLSSDAKRYKGLMRMGQIRTKGSDIVTFLRDYLSKEKKGTGRLKLADVRKTLMRQPHWLHSSVRNVKEVISFLESFGVFSKAQIYAALTLTLYPKEKLEREFDNVLKSGEAELGDEWFLQMVLYFLERVVHFSGDAVWEDSHRGVTHHDDDEDVVIEGGEGDGEGKRHGDYQENHEQDEFDTEPDGFHEMEKKETHKKRKK